MTCVGDAVAIAPCEHLLGILYNLFLGIRKIAIVLSE